jgi:hypothetical protein
VRLFDEVLAMASYSGFMVVWVTRSVGALGIRSGEENWNYVCVRKAAGRRTG